MKWIMKLDTFDSKQPPFPAIPLSSSSFCHVRHLLLYRKPQKTVQFENVLKNEIKERNIAPSKPVLSV